MPVEADALPDRFALEGNYPNPFNPSTTIPFTLPESGTVRLEVYNSIGQRVRQMLLNIPMPDKLNDRVGLFRSLIADKRVLVLLDNAWDEPQVRPLLPGAGTYPG